MTTLADHFYQTYHIRREVSKIVDLSNLLLAILKYDLPQRQPAQVADIVRRIQQGDFLQLSGNQKNEFTNWLIGYLEINRTLKGTTYVPLHPALTLSFNGEHVRCDIFMRQLASCFSADERDTLINRIWDIDQMPLIEHTIHDLLDWQLSNPDVAANASPELFAGCYEETSSLSPKGILVRLKQDLLALSENRLGVQNFCVHAGRLIAFAQVRYMLAKASVNFDLPIYAAPAADSHEGVKTLAHEIIEVHRACFEKTLEEQFTSAMHAGLQQMGLSDDPPNEEDARRAVVELFHPKANIVPQGRYAQLHEEIGPFSMMAVNYYWSQGGARGRFMRLLHSAHLNLAKKAGFASSRSRYSQWHFYWLAPSLVETLLQISRSRIGKERILMADLLEEWRIRYGIVMLIDPSWENAYRKYFRGLGSPEALNEANRRRFTEILAERGRLHKNSDDFPWVILRD